MFIYTNKTILIFTVTSGISVKELVFGNRRIKHLRTSFRHETISSSNSFENKEETKTISDIDKILEILSTFNNNSTEQLIADDEITNSTISTQINATNILFSRLSALNSIRRLN